MNQTTFAMYFGNRGFFPETLVAGARRDMDSGLKGGKACVFTADGQ